MKKYFAILFAALLLFSAGCGEKPERSEVGEVCSTFINFNSDYVMQGDVIFFREGTSGSLHGSKDESAQRILYADVVTGESGPLCGKPECTHKDKNCNAYIGDRFTMIRLFMHDDRLYWIYGFYNSAHLYSMNTDGTDRRDEMAIDPELYSLAYGYGTAQICDGALYVCGNASSIENGESFMAGTVFRQRLGKTKGELIYSSRADQLATFGMISGTKLYFADSEQPNAEEYDSLTTKLFVYDTADETLTQLGELASLDCTFIELFVEEDRVTLSGVGTVACYDPASGSFEFGPISSDYNGHYAGSVYYGWTSPSDYYCFDLDGNMLYSRKLDMLEFGSFDTNKYGRTYIGFRGDKQYYAVMTSPYDPGRELLIMEFDSGDGTPRSVWSSSDN